MKEIRHLIRAGLLALVVIIGFTIVRFIALPKSWGEYGHYRANAVVEEMAKEPVYQGADACKKCHVQKHEEWNSGKHRVVNCENCHGQAKEHVVKPMVKSGTKTIVINRSMELCLRCHLQLLARPHDFTEISHPQIDPEKHLKGKGALKCFNCHNPHQPDLKRPEVVVEEKVEQKVVKEEVKEKVEQKAVKKEAAKPIEKKAVAAVSKIGREVYEKTCLVCHGEKGEPADFLDPKPPNFSSSSYKSTLEQIANFIRKGKGKQMPAFEQELSDEEIKELAKYIQSFKE